MSDKVLFFEEIDGQKRRVALRGSTAPHGGRRRDPAFSLGGTLRSTKTNEPGQRRPVRSITGTSERPLAIKGHLRDGLIGADGGAKRVRTLIDDIRLQARPLRIIWDGELRYGFLEDAEFGVETGADFTYHLEFGIDDVGDGTDNDVLKRARGPITVPDVAGLRDTVESARASLVSVPGISIDLASSLNDLFAAAFNPLGQLIGAFEDVEQGVEDLADAFRRAANAAAALLSRIQHLAGTIGAVTDPTDTDDGAARAAWERRRAEALLELREVSARAYALGVEAEKRLRGASSGRYVVTAAGDTIEGIAARERVSAEAIRALNPGVSFAPAEGTKLRLP